DVGRQRVHVTTLKGVDRVGLVRSEVLVDEIVPVAVAAWNGAHRLAIFDLLEARGDAGCTVSRMARDRTVRSQGDRDPGEAIQHKKCSLHVRISSESGVEHHGRRRQGPVRQGRTAPRATTAWSDGHDLLSMTPSTDARR